jgi:hypothetical protein
MTQPSFWSDPVLHAIDSPAFAGADYSPARDDARLTAQIGRIFALMADGQWRTLPEIHAATGDPEASISAQLRHLRKPAHGSHDVQRKYVGAGLYKYRVVAKVSL